MGTSLPVGPAVLLVASKTHDPLSPTICSISSLTVLFVFKVRINHTGALRLSGRETDPGGDKCSPSITGLKSEELPPHVYISKMEFSSLCLS